MVVLFRTVNVLLGSCWGSAIRLIAFTVRWTGSKNSTDKTARKKSGLGVARTKMIHPAAQGAAAKEGEMFCTFAVA